MSKKVELFFMKYASTDDEWQSVVMEVKDTLVVVDIYNKIWGPCEVLANNFLNLYYELSDKLSLRFVRAEVDHLEEPSLAHFKGSAQANFLFYLDGELIRDVKGPNIPEIKELINTKAPPLQA
eukprot:CAMPEP_0206178678 /NCGR_PEP_ID=MMETSP1474-20131121/64988_1 /ASSEMBLY_ACC=CAM_ASM_001110 /TAXON_ID=97495 /ORGANISM="Imantonia sp., Strain RCC918" /LENGTH=122 /DNA_ID=CAMNT_0053591345 /DNA_START=24 /DNA_END=392 /DNA_ORIENTATION=-